MFPCGDDGVVFDRMELSSVGNIYKRIKDDLSREIFECRLMYSLTGDDKFIERLTRCNEACISWEKRLCGNWYVYGAGKRAERLCGLFPRQKWQGFIDRKKTGSLHGFPIIPLNAYIPASDDKLIISVKNEMESIKRDLVELGIKPEQIYYLESILQDFRADIYFNPRCIEKMRECDGAFLDIGSYDGVNTLRAFEELKNTSCAYLFEPDRKSHAVCKSNLEGLKERFILSDMGISDVRGESRFTENGVASRIDQEGDQLIHTDTIDNLFGDIRVGFIKMDVEGAELNVLKGACKVIRRDHPNMAISIYHKRDDIIRLPEEILSIVPEYVFRMGHHSMEWDDTVLYATVEG